MNLLGLMAGLGMAFNAGEHQERTHSMLLPAGWYKVQIVNSEVKPTKKPGGVRLNLQFKILDGDFAGRVLFGGYNVKNDNPVAVQIAMEELAELSRAVMTPVWNDTEQLHGKPFNLKIKVRPAQGDYEPTNEPVIYQLLSNMEGVNYATKLDMASLPKSTPASAAQSGAFGAQQPQQQQQGFQPQPQQQGFQPQQQPVQQQPTQAFQPQQQVQQQPVQQVQQQVQQQPVQQQQPGNTNFVTAAQNQPWNSQQQPTQQEQQPQQPQQQMQQQPQQVMQEQPVQQQPVQQQMQQQPVQQQQPVEQQQGGQPNWAQQQVQPGTEQVQQQQVQQQVQMQPQDDIAQAAQAKTPPWKKPAQEDGAAQ